MTNGGRSAGPLRRGLPTGRLEALSDGVFAIAITLLVLDIAIPASAGTHLLRSLGHQWPSYLAYVVSFSTIGALWLGHNVITEYLERANAAFIRLNLLLLLLVAFLPFPTRLFAEYIGQSRPESIAAAIYGASLLVSSTLLWVLWRYAVHAGLVRADAGDEEVRLLTQRLTPGLGGYVVLSWSGSSRRPSRWSGTWPSPCTTSSRSAGSAASTCSAPAPGGGTGQVPDRRPGSPAAACPPR